MPPNGVTFARALGTSLRGLGWFSPAAGGFAAIHLLIDSQKRKCTHNCGRGRGRGRNGEYGRSPPIKPVAARWRSSRHTAFWIPPTGPLRPRWTASCCWHDQAFSAALFAVRGRTPGTNRPLKNASCGEGRATTFATPASEAHQGRLDLHKSRPAAGDAGLNAASARGDWQKPLRKSGPSGGLRTLP